MKRKYGISLDDYDAMYLDQNAQCAICGQDFANLPSRPCVDHDHETGIVRALLCRFCNLRVAVYESPIFPNIVAYVQKHKGRKK